MSKRSISLVNERLFQQAGFINGQFLTSKSNEVFQVHNPATGAVEGTVPKFTAQETHDAINAAHHAQKEWGTTLNSHRASKLQKFARLMHEHEKDLAAICTMEAGKPLAESLGEIRYSAGYVEWYAGEAERIDGDIIPSPRHGVRTLVVKQPVGVVAVVTPWNFPSAMITRSIAGALAAGCTVVVKPSEFTPFSAMALCELAKEAGIPHGVVNCVTGDAKTIGGALMESDVVRKLCFTGSTAVGKHLLKQCADTVKRTAMELGGNAPFIVFDDANVDQAVAAAMPCKFRNAGQTCVCANRFYIHKSVAKEFVEKLHAQVKALKVGNGVEHGVTMGPMIYPAAVTKMEALVKDAVSKGGNVLCGGKRVDGPGNFFQPTIITEATHDMDMVKGEIFGPIASILTFECEDEVIKLANDVPAGLGSYIFTKDYRRQWRVSERLQYGMVGVNEGVMSSPVAPFGGVKQSGMGRDGSKYGIENFIDIKYVLMGGGI